MSTRRERERERDRERERETERERGGREGDKRGGRKTLPLPPPSIEIEARKQNSQLTIISPSILKSACSYSQIWTVCLD